MSLHEQKLIELRKRIDQVDSDLVKLLNKRSQLIIDVAKLKYQFKLPLYDAKRESKILEKLASNNATLYQAKDLVAIFHSVFRAGLNQQQIFCAESKE